MTNQVVVDSRFENEPAKIVLKYKMELSPDPQVVAIPIGAHLLRAEFIASAYLLRGHWLLWYEVPLVTRDHDVVLQSIGTGVPFPKCAKYVATGFRFGSGSLPQEVWHLYEYPSGAKVVDA